ncbi:MAG: hypothetical protein KatS3mg057_0947 [Herpetosiphonaceae bacterium]|nr:MAG: hypothetical protein KatS3mg057_0947 [Herpetosiphonaceae bacterium]
MSQNRPSRFNPYQDDPDRVDPDAKTRRVERPSSSRQEPEQDWREMVAPNWRDRRRGRSRQRSAGPFPFPIDSSGFFMWISRGGWKTLVATALGLLILLIVILLTGDRSDTPDENQLAVQPTQARQTTPLPTGAIIRQPDDGQPEPTIPPTRAPQPQVYVVSGTGFEGLFLRESPGGTILKTLPEGTRVEVLGPDQEAHGFVWKHVREPGGLEGWAAADWLQPVQ